MIIYLATDHAGYNLKEHIKKYLLEQKFDVVDCGALTFDKNDDYPDFISLAASKISKEPDNKAIILGGSGQGEAILANKYKHVRAVVYYGPRLPKEAVDADGRTSEDPLEIIKLTRQHNDANVLSLAARLLTPEETLAAVALWLKTPFSNNPRFRRRIEKTAAIEKNL